MYGFEFDESKSASNLKKHGIDFVSAQELWDDPGLVEVKAAFESEPRFLIIGRIKEKHWSAVVTYREGKVRIITVRSSRKTEVELYES